MISLAERTVLVTPTCRWVEYVTSFGRKVSKGLCHPQPAGNRRYDPRVIPLQPDATDAVSHAEAADLATDAGILINNISRASLGARQGHICASRRAGDEPVRPPRAILRVRRPHRREIRCHR